MNIVFRKQKEIHFAVILTLPTQHQITLPPLNVEYAYGPLLRL